MGPRQSKISKQDVGLGLRFAWHEAPDTLVVNAIQIVALGILTPLLDAWPLVAIALTLLGGYVGSTAYLLYKGLAGARDARDFDTYITQQFAQNRHITDTPWADFKWVEDDPE